jgi:hypothetical protein
MLLIVVVLGLFLHELASGPELAPALHPHHGLMPALALTAPRAGWRSTTDELSSGWPS